MVCGRLYFRFPCPFIVFAFPVASRVFFIWYGEICRFSFATWQDKNWIFRASKDTLVVLFFFFFFFFFTSTTSSPFLCGGRLPSELMKFIRERVLAIGGDSPFKANVNYRKIGRRTYLLYVSSSNSIPFISGHLIVLVPTCSCAEILSVGLICVSNRIYSERRT